MKYGCGNMIEFKLLPLCHSTADIRCHRQLLVQVHHQLVLGDSRGLPQTAGLRLPWSEGREIVYLEGSGPPKGPVEGVIVHAPLSPPVVEHHRSHPAQITPEHSLPPP